MYKVLTIAGSDPSGGAGATADMKTFMAHNVYGMSVLTALVAQNTMGVNGMHPIPPSFLAQQLACVFEDIVPDAIKIGMVLDYERIHVIAQVLQKHRDVPVVLDPVMVSTSKDSLLQKDAIHALCEELFPFASIITPNIQEAQVLAGKKLCTAQDMVDAARIISSFYDGYILIKGGHRKECADDMLYDKNNIVWYRGTHIDNPNTHGTGCTLSSAIAANLAKGETMEESVRKAKAFVRGALQDGLDLGKGSGPLNHCWNTGTIKDI